MLKTEFVQTMSLNIKFSYLAENSKFSRSNSYFSILTPTFLRDGFLNSCFQNPSENSGHDTHDNFLATFYKGVNFCNILYTFRHTNPFWKGDYSRRKEFNPKRI